MKESEGHKDENIKSFSKKKSYSVRESENNV